MTQQQIDERIEQQGGPIPVDRVRIEIGALLKALNDRIREAYEEGRGIGVNIGHKGRAGMEKIDALPIIGIAVGESRKA
jgi:hypothetical protein